jgi:penicillin amidase
MPNRSRRRWPRRLLRVLLVVLASLLGLALVAALGAVLLLRGSLPRLDGERELVGLDAVVTVTRDSLGVPDIQAASRADAARALGYLHAQDRFFQMDLQRRGAARR